MTSYERVMTVVQHGIPDRVPVDLHNFLTTVAYARMPMAAALQSGEMMAEAQLKFWRDFGHDMLLVENGVVAEAGACGCQIDFYDDRPPRVAGHVLAGGLEKIDDLAVPDPATTPPMCYVVDAVRILRRELGNSVFIMGRADQGPVALAAALRGYEQFILDMTYEEQPELIARVIDYCVRVQTRYAAVLREAGAHGTSMGEMGVDIIGPKLHRKWAHPFDCRAIAAISRPDFPMALHICGDSTRILPEMLATGAPILELDYKTNMHKAKELMRGRSTFLGPINPELIWAAASPDEVDAAVAEAIQILAPGGDLILGPGCALGSDTPAANIHALIEAAHKYGVYNPDGTLRGLSAR
jgi:uroporphyrinogen decarboxylase